MADEHDQADDELLLTEELPEGEEPEQHEDAGEFAIELEGEEPQDETPLVKQLRDEVRARDRELSSYRKAQTPAAIIVGEEPTLEGCDYDEDRFKTEWREWNGRKAQAENADRDANEQVRVRNEAWTRTLAGHRAKAAALPVNDYDSAEATVIAALPETMQSVLVQYTDDSAKVVYALAKHPAMLAKLAQETDPIKFVIAAREMEGKLKVTTRRKAPEPEAGTIQRGSAPIAPVSSDKKLKKLEEEARRTGNRTELIAYKQKMEASK